MSIKVGKTGFNRKINEDYSKQEVKKKPYTGRVIEGNQHITIM